MFPCVLCNIYRRRSSFEWSNTLFKMWTVVTFLFTLLLRRVRVHRRRVCISVCWSALRRQTSAASRRQILLLFCLICSLVKSAPIKTDTRLPHSTRLSLPLLPLESLNSNLFSFRIISQVRPYMNAQMLRAAQTLHSSPSTSLSKRSQSHTL